MISGLIWKKSSILALTYRPIQPSGLLSGALPLLYAADIFSWMFVARKCNKYQVEWSIYNLSGRCLHQLWRVNHNLTKCTYDFFSSSSTVYQASKSWLLIAGTHGCWLHHNHIREWAQVYFCVTSFFFTTLFCGVIKQETDFKAWKLFQALSLYQFENIT